MNKNEEKLVPELRFNEFKGEWEEIRFNDYFKFLRSNSFSRNQLNYEEGEVLNIHYGDIHSKFSSLFVASKESVPYINNNLDLSKFTEDDFLREGDVVIADASEDYKDIGKSIEIIDLGGNKAVAGLHTIPVRPEGPKSQGFLGNLMKSWRIRHEIMRLANGISVLGISKSNISNLNLFLPSIQEQQKIASFLSLIDKKIELLKKKKELLELYKKGVMQKIFNREIRFKDENGNDYPEWEEKRLGEICRKIKSGGTPKSTEARYYNGEIPFLSISDMTTQGKYLRSTERSITKDGLEASSSWLVPKGSIIYSMYASIGLVAINKIPIAISQAVLCLLPTEEYINEYIYYYLYYFQKFVHKFIETGTQGNLNAQIVKNFKISLPSNVEQRKVASYLSSLDKRIDIIKDFTYSTRLFKKGLLQKMFI